MNPNYHLDHFFETPLKIDDINLVQIGRMFCSPETVIDEHLHLNWFELTIATEGKGILKTNSENIPIKSGDIYLSFPADVHTIYSDKSEPLKYDYLSFYPLNPEYLAKFEKIILHYQYPNSRLFFDSRISFLLESALLEFQNQNLQYRIETLSHILHLIEIFLIRKFDIENNHETLLNPKQKEIFCFQVMNYIDTHIFTLKNLNEISTITNYNYSYISKLFRQTTGQTLLEYYSNSRLKKASVLISENRLKMKEIAGLLNYSSVYAFSKAYKEKYGIAPTATRKIHADSN